MADGQLLPIKVVFPRQQDYLTPPVTARQWEPFGEVTPQRRSELTTQVRSVRTHFAGQFEQWRELPAVAKVTLKPEAVAKTYRPTELFNQDSCPIIGGNKLGELYVSVRPNGLGRLENQLLADESQRTVAHISTLERIEPYRTQDALATPPTDQPEFQGKRKRRGKQLRCRLFRHQSSAVDAALDQAFEQFAQAEGVGDTEVMDYADGLRVYCLRNVPPEKMATLAGFVGVQSLTAFPEYRIVRTASRTLANISAAAFPLPETGREYGVVGLIDSGTDSTNKLLQAWVMDRYDFVPRSMQNNEHGSFVAGLLVHARKLNHGDQRFPDASSRIVDVVAFDREGEISEYDLITVIDRAIARFPFAKVWNLSLGLVGSPCGDNEFSLLAAALDERTKRHDVLFVVAAGNYTTPPFRSWPPQAGLQDDDRITPPADSLRSLTIGSVAHLDTVNTRVRRDEPSPFGRRGPGPAYVIKPELAYPGGNCDMNGQYVQTGLVSVDGSGHIAENIGTSFATPLGSTVAANVFLELDTSSDEVVSPTLVKALLLHSAFMRNGRLDPETMPYYGIGSTPDLHEIISCRRSSATVIFQAPLRARPQFGKRPFPMPACLVQPDAGLQCEVFMTLVYDPPLDRRFGIEYCRCNVSASLGTVTIDPETNRENYTREIPSVPKELCESYEKDLIKHGYKWSPLKLYHRKFSRGPWTKSWRLTLELLNRSEHSVDEQQDVTLIVTLRALKPSVPVYDEFVSEMARLGWGAQDLRIRSRQRVQP